MSRTQTQTWLWGPYGLFFTLIAEGNWAIGAAALPKAPFSDANFWTGSGRTKD
jgi:hypothetical protein